ncbi:MAG: hypothetical protein DRI69_04770 [Bacteroidetes bacterium]|nr:MAG: hypothetical protein DRI69_04770 [Bacteroidota bacterium]
MKHILVILALTATLAGAKAQHSEARQWNEELLEAIRHDYARPTVHARNLFHVSVAMYDAWAAYDTVASTSFLGNTLGDYDCAFDGVAQPSDLQSAKNEALSYASYRLLVHRFSNSPDSTNTRNRLNALFASLGYDEAYTDDDYTNGEPAALGNYIANQLIAFGFQDGSNEQNLYENEYYEAINPNLIAEKPGNPDLIDPNRWQPLALELFIDQSGNIIFGEAPPFLGPEWGQVVPFSLQEEDLTIYTRDNFDYLVYHDPGPPPYLDTNAIGGLSEEYKWGFSLVAAWASHLDPADSVVWDISPASIGNIPYYPETVEGLRDFYDYEEGGDISNGHALNPFTGAPYEPQYVPRADYARVLAEFWADGPDSETPPGHWFTLLNYVNDHPEFEKKFRGQGEIVEDLEWDVKAYLILGGAMHDVAISAWGMKGWYDYIRPISSIRCMADFGQSSDSTKMSYHPAGIPLSPGLIELVEWGDPLQGDEGANVGKIKLYSWRGPDYIDEPEDDYAGVDWILAENWWPYQRPTFITPPFAGYVSGHSTFSRAAAEIMELLTGDAFFPGGMGEFEAPKNEFLVFEDGPSQTITLQWATYRDASDQTSLSRIWGGIHPPADDIPGRLIGEVIGVDAFLYGEKYFNIDNDQDGYFSWEDCDDYNADIHPDAFDIPENGIDEDCDGEDAIVSAITFIENSEDITFYPNPVTDRLYISIDFEGQMDIQLSTLQGRVIRAERIEFSQNIGVLDMKNIPNGIYFIKVINRDTQIAYVQKIIRS